MSVTLTGQEGFFTRHGAIIGEYNRVAALYGTALDAGFLSIWSQYASSDQQAVENLPSAVQAFKTTGLTYQSTLVADGQLSTILQVGRTESLVPESVQRAMEIVSVQMKNTAQSINRAVVAGTVVTGASNLGDAALVFSNTNIYGDPLDMTYAEVVSVTCTADSTGFDQTLVAVGEAILAPNLGTWPGGSGANTTFNVTDQALDGLLTDGNFQLWEGTGSNTPTAWEIINGDPGVTVFRSVAGGLRAGTHAAQITSDGSQATQLGQDVSLTVNTVYAVCVWAKINTVTATGTFRIALTDDNGTLLTDDAGASLASSVGINGGSGVDTTYKLFTAFFSTPRQLPTTVNLRVGTSVAATSGRIITFGLVGIVAATPLYGPSGTGTAGPYVAAFAGDEATALNDFWTLTITNDLTTKSFALGLQRLYDMRGMGVYMPSATSETIPDSLVTN